jgi:hypothetical protein
MNTAEIQQICRSLLQKGVRRSAVAVVEQAVVYLLEQGDAVWLRNRLAVVACEEVPGYVAKLDLSTDEQCLLKQYQDMAGAVKNKNAAGLGGLAASLEQGYRQVLSADEAANRSLKVIVQAIRRPPDFWAWLKRVEMADSARAVIDKAEAAFKLSALPGDKVFMLACAYLAASEGAPPLLPAAKERSADFPYWIAIDKHTAVGKQALAACATALGVNPQSLGTLQYYLEGAQCHDLESSPWWQREQAWVLAREGLAGIQGEALWREARAYLHEHLGEHTQQLQDELSRAVNRYRSTPTHQQALF